VFHSVLVKKTKTKQKNKNKTKQKNKKQKTQGVNAIEHQPFAP